MTSLLHYMRDDLNLALDATVTANSADSAYPIANVIALPISDPYRSTGIASEYIAIDFGSSVAISFAAIINHNLTSGATITLKAGTTVAVSDFSVAVTRREFDAYLEIAQQTYRYWQIAFADASNPDGYIQVGYIQLGVLLSFAKGYVAETPFDDEMVNVRQQTQAGVPAIRHLYRRVSRVFSFRNMEISQRNEIRTVYTSLQGDATPIFVIPDETIYEGYFGRFINETLRSVPGFLWGIEQLYFREESRGFSMAN